MIRKAGPGQVQDRVQTGKYRQERAGHIDRNQDVQPGRIFRVWIEVQWPGHKSRVDGV